MEYKPIKTSNQCVFASKTNIILYPPAPPSGTPAETERPRIDITPDDGGTESEGLGPRIALAPFSRWTTKNWGPGNFAGVGRRLAREVGAKVFVLGSAADQPDGERLARDIPGARNVCGRFGLVEMCAFLKTVDLMVSVDSGPLHWADAMGVPIVAVYGSTNPDRTGPYFQRSWVVTEENLPCRPCHARVCRRGDIACLSQLSADRVADIALSRL